jgi:hypothetical protein
LSVNFQLNWQAWLLPPTHLCRCSILVWKLLTHACGKQVYEVGYCTHVQFLLPLVLQTVHFQSYWSHYLFSYSFLWGSFILKHAFKITFCILSWNSSYFPNNLTVSIHYHSGCHRSMDFGKRSVMYSQPRYHIEYFHFPKNSSEVYLCNCFLSAWSFLLSYRFAFSRMSFNWNLSSR